MPILKRDHRTGHSLLRSVLKRNTYLTDGSRLFRCIGWDRSLVLLEDCMTLEAIACSAEELRTAGMRLVQPAR